ncbi:hypothetical protein BKI52_27000 [marine bacterium AO1-C]|nr:hypothetical protein BKI52_27000 [marine bacterium AO1-C]
MNVPEIVQQVLASNEKNISDLINKELSIILLADFIYRNPHLESAMSGLYQEVYKKTVINLTQMFEDLLEQQNTQLNQENQTQVKQYVQWFVNDLVNEYQEEVKEKVRWLEQKGANRE